MAAVAGPLARAVLAQASPSIDTSAAVRATFVPDSLRVAEASSHADKTFFTRHDLAVAGIGFGRRERGDSGPARPVPPADFAERSVQLLVLGRLHRLRQALVSVDPCGRGLRLGAKVVRYAHAHRKNRLDRWLLGTTIAPSPTGGALVMRSIDW